MDNELYPEPVPSSIVDLAPILRVAKQTRPEFLRVSQLCLSHFLHKLQDMNFWSIANKDDLKFAEDLEKRFREGEQPSLTARGNQTDAFLIKKFFLRYYNIVTSSQSEEAFEFVRVVYGVLCAVFRVENIDVPLEIRNAARCAQEKSMSLRYNILPLHSGASPIMHLNEVKAVISDLNNTEGLTWPTTSGPLEKGELDVLDWLQVKYGFQRDNVRNQREHLVLLLANLHARLPEPKHQLDERAVEDLMHQVFDNYLTWCKYHGRESALQLPGVPRDQPKVQQWRLLCLGLYFLIWGEAGNVRLMPECICYVFHHSAEVLHRMLDRDSCCISVEPDNPANGWDDDEFLKKRITPIYQVIEREAIKNKNGTAPPSKWCNYDDLNEYFWSAECFSLGWPMRHEGDFFRSTRNGAEGTYKCNFVERRTFCHIFRSFGLVWTLFILTFQVLVIIARSDASLFDIFQKNMLYSLSSIFITAAFLRALQSILGISMNFSVYKRRNLVLDVIKMLLWLCSFIVLLCLYHYKTSIYHHKTRIPLYIIAAVVIDPLRIILTAVLFFCPMLRFLQKLSEPKTYLGRGMREMRSSLIIYAVFWLIILCCFKIPFSYFYQIKPLMRPTIDTFNIHNAKNYADAAALWAPVLLIYFMDAQIWYTLFSTCYGGYIGAAHRLGEINDLDMLMSRFMSLPDALNKCLVVSDQPKNREQLSENLSKKVDHEKFAHIWNEIICSFREEDLISDREMHLLLVPHSSDPWVELIRWPAFLLASKIPSALDMAVHSRLKDAELWKRICEDKFMESAVQECYASLRIILLTLANGKAKSSIRKIFEQVDISISEGTFLKNYMVTLQKLVTKFKELVELLKVAEPSKESFVRPTVKEIFRLASSHMTGDEVMKREHFDMPTISYPSATTSEWDTMIRRLAVILSMDKSPSVVPINPGPRRRLLFFANSLFMNMPGAPPVRNMKSFSVLTSYSDKETVFEEAGSMDNHEDSMIGRKTNPDEWEHFLERLNCKTAEEVWNIEKNKLQLRQWASSRRPTLCRTVRGMMNYKRALMLEASLEMASDRDFLNAMPTEKIKKSHVALSEAIADMKFSCVIACQDYAQHKKTGDHRFTEILSLMVNNPSLRVAYIDEVKETIEGGTHETAYYSVLVKAVDNVDQEIYRIKLPGPAILGEGKPEHQNHALIYTRGEALQLINTDQANYLEEALKMRNLLEEFKKDRSGREPTILGVREDIFFRRDSSRLVKIMSKMENAFVTARQCVLAGLLKVRFHYGHPDVFDKIFHITRGGISKASKGVNSCTDNIYAGFNSTLRGGKITYNNYIQVGKGRDVGMDQIWLLEARVACEKGEQTLSRDIYRLGHGYDLFRQLSCYCSTIGDHITSTILVVAVYAFLYGRLYHVLSGSKRSSLDEAVEETIGFNYLFLSNVISIPMFFVSWMEKDLATAVIERIISRTLYTLFFIPFSICSKFHFICETIRHGRYKHKDTDGIPHETLDQIYRFYSRSHITKGLELMTLLIVYQIYGTVGQNSYYITIFNIYMWFFISMMILAPFFHNLSGLEWAKTLKEWDDWTIWLRESGGRGANASWESWWEEEQEYLGSFGLFGRLCEIIFSLRFIVYHLFVFRLHVANNHILIAYVLSCFAIVVAFILLVIVSKGKKNFDAKWHRCMRLISPVAILAMAGALFIQHAFLRLSVWDILFNLQAFVIPGWGILQIVRVCLPSRPFVKGAKRWVVVREVSRVYEYLMGTIVFGPVVSFVWSISFVNPRAKSLAGNMSKAQQSVHDSNKVQ